MPPPATFKITHFFNTIVGLPAGWTESFYTLTGSDVDSINSALGQYENARRNLLHPDYAILGSRVTDVLNPRLTRTEIYKTSYGQGTFVGARQGDKEAEQPFDGLMIQLLSQTVIGSSAPRRARMFIMRGLPDVVIDDTYVYSGGDSARWNPAFQAWLRLVAVDNFAGGSPPLIPLAIRQFKTSQPQPIATATVSDDKLSIQITLANQTTPDAIAVGDTFKITGDKGAAWFNGLWKARNVTVTGGVPTIISWPKKRPIRGTPALTTSTLCYRIGPGYAPIQKAKAVKGAKKSTGRPFFLLRGRRKVQLG
jgi:hypothetical protein